MPEYEKGIVSKPWGYEYLMYRSDRIGVWFLHIAAGRKTSLHCHPTKKTGYVLLSGEAEVSFLNDTTRLKAISKLMIREGLFHSTKALSPEGVSVIEVESPPDKTNLVRLDDAYGRKEEPYEGPDSVVPMTAECIMLATPELDRPLIYQVAGVAMTVERRNDLAPLRMRPSGEVILVLDGGLVSKNNDPILSPGDVVTISTFSCLADTFTAPQGMSFVSFRREQNPDA